ncbi:RNA polymerase II transcription factor SIII subunit A-domain-containing protein [Gigaspora rosea]|uniref:RNA polymerase II transcription factor SIII subunit A-domain-containing protein n=1 Tax=Gigaspora rosea TaxID=44941 RepID=A0A397UI30_9GLOM|nr:RNA polymerase II transcription factor SIII subunit A-domain-containing protein [Gigaspora rosea]
MSSTSALNRTVTKKSSLPKLLELCYKKLISHKHLLYKVGKAPYYLLKPVLRHCTPDELRNLEEANPHIMDEDMELWRDHYVRDNSNPSRRIVDPDDEDWRQLYWRSKEEQASRLANALEKLRQSKKQHDRQKEEKKIKILPGLHDPSRKRNLTGWQKMTPLQKLRRNYEKNDYYRPAFKQESSTIRTGSNQIGLKNNLRHEPYPTVGAVAPQRRVNAIVTNNNMYKNTTQDASRTSVPAKTASTKVVAKNNTTKLSDNSHVYRKQESSTIRTGSNQIGLKNNLRREPYPTVGAVAPQRRVNAIVSNNNMYTNSTLAASRTSVPAKTASTKVVAKKNTTKLSDNSHVIRTKSDVRQKLYSKSHYDIQNDKAATIKSSKHLKSKRVA